MHDEEDSMSNFVGGIAMAILDENIKNGGTLYIPSMGIRINNQMGWKVDEEGKIWGTSDSVTFEVTDRNDLRLKGEATDEVIEYERLRSIERNRIEKDK